MQQLWGLVGLCYIKIVCTVKEWEGNITMLEADFWQQLLPEIGDWRVGLGVRKNSLWS